MKKLLVVFLMFSLYGCGLYNKDMVTKNYQFIVAEMRRIIQSKNLIIRGLEMQNRNLQNEIAKLKIAKN